MSRHRLLIGRGYRPTEGEPLDIEWGAGDLRDIRKLRGLEFVSEIGPKLMEIVDDYVTGDGQGMRRDMHYMVQVSSDIHCTGRGVAGPGCRDASRGR